MLEKERAVGNAPRKKRPGGGREERNFTLVAGNFTLLLGQVSKAQLVLVENVVPVREFSSLHPLLCRVLALKTC